MNAGLYYQPAFLRRPVRFHEIILPIMPALLMLIFLSGMLPGQGQSAHGADSLKPESVSPYMIEWFIDLNEDADLSRFWRLLKIDVPDDGSHRCGGNCIAESFDIEVAREDRARTVALRISFETGEFYKYLIFRSEPGAGGRWKFLGHIDARGERYGSPAHRVESGEGRTWLVIRELWGRGSGMLARGEVWYEIREDGLKRVLAYPVEGHNAPCRNRLGRSYKSFLARHGSVNGVYTVPVQLLVSYNISDCSKRYDQPSLFAKGQKAYFVWSEAEGRFVLDTSESDVTEEELRIVYNLEGLGAERFVEYNFNEVLNVASRGGAVQREWLKRFLAGIQDGPRKAALQQALQK